MQFSPQELDVLSEMRPHKASRWIEHSQHVQAFAVLDHGATPALGELRMSTGPDTVTALRLACRLARRESICYGLLGVARAGAAIVAVEHPEASPLVLAQVLTDRLGATPLRVRASEGLDPVVASVEGVVPLATETLTRLRGRILGACLQAMPAWPGKGARATIVGATAAGHDAATTLRELGVALSVWDADPERAHQLAQVHGATVIDGWIEADTDLLVPCAAAPLIDRDAAERLRATMVCGLMPHPFADSEAGAVLDRRDRWVVPSILSATAESLMLAVAEGVLDEEATLALIEHTAREVLASARGAGDRATSLAIARAKEAKDAANTRT